VRRRQRERRREGRESMWIGGRKTKEGPDTRGIEGGGSEGEKEAYQIFLTLMDKLRH
jgi:hypothetical protein